jgi:hypothetical protein
MPLPARWAAKFSKKEKAKEGDRQKGTGFLFDFYSMNGIGLVY